MVAVVVVVVVLEAVAGVGGGGGCRGGEAAPELEGLRSQKSENKLSQTEADLVRRSDMF